MHIHILRVLVCLFLLADIRALAQSAASEFPEHVIGNMVAITVSYTDDGSDSLSRGMGFIIGEREGVYHVATARHTFESFMEDTTVVPITLSENTRINVQVQGRDDRFNASIVPFEPRDGRWVRDLDLTLLSFNAQNEIRFHSEVLASGVDLSTGDELRVVGDYNPRELVLWQLSSESMAVNSVYSDANRKSIAFGSVAVKNGVSGGAVVSKNGIVGMVINWDGYHNTAVAIEEIRDLVENTGSIWQLKMAKPSATTVVSGKPAINNSVERNPVVKVRAVSFVPDSVTEFLSDDFEQLLFDHDISLSEGASGAIRVLVSDKGLYRDEEFGEIVIGGGVSVKLLNPDGRTLHRETIAIDGRSFSNHREAASRAARHFVSQFESSASMRIIEQFR